MTRFRITGCTEGEADALPKLAMQPTAVSETGRRQNNEDAIFASPRLVAVADGVGGATAGELASRLAVRKMIGLDNRRLLHSLEWEFAAAVADANDVIGFATEYDPGLLGMATTLTAVTIRNDGTYLVANVGDSRTYLMRDGRLRQLSRDDSLVQELIDRGVLTEADARAHPQRNVVLRALDGTERDWPVLRAVPAQLADRLLLCSDGVSDYLGDDQIADCLAVAEAAVAARQLVNAALDHGSRDNVTAIVADVVECDEPCGGWLDSLPAPSAAGEPA
jgi:serine/threonine protein phosphatase PrpC